MKINDVKMDIVEAEVYRRGCTMVARAAVDVVAGKNHLVVDGLPEDFDEGGMALKMPADVVQGQVQVVRQTGLLGEFESPTAELDQQVDELDRKIENKQLELDAWKGLAARMEGEAAIEYLDRLPSVLDGLSKELTELSAERRKLAKRRDEERDYRNRPRLELDVTADAATTMPVEITLRSDNAGWRPGYDVLVGTPDEPLGLRMRAQVWQRTGSDWESVCLRLGTGTAAVMGDLPRFAPRLLHKIEPTVLPVSASLSAPSRPLSAMRMQASVSSAPVSAEDTFVGDLDFDSLVEAKAAPAVVTEQAVATTYELAQAQALASDGNEQTFEVATKELPVTYRLYVYPRKAQAAYLVAHLDAEPSPEVLEQAVSVYIEGSYAGQIRLGRGTDDAGYELPLGRDGRVRVRYDEKTQRSQRLLGSKVTRDFNCTITVESHRQSAMDLVVLEQVPVSQDREIEVTLRDVADATFDKARGELRWEQLIEPNATVRLTAAYTVTYPKGTSINL